MSQSQCSSVNVVSMPLAGRQEILGNIPGAVDIRIFTPLPRPGLETRSYSYPIYTLPFPLILSADSKGEVG